MPPGATVGTSVVWVMVRAATVTEDEQPGSVLPVGQLFPVVAEVMVKARVPLPGSGLLAVAENVIVAVAPAARLPVQVRFGLL